LFLDLLFLDSLFGDDFHSTDKTREFMLHNEDVAELTFSQFLTNVEVTFFCFA